jgi:hypothetical protein
MSASVATLPRSMPTKPRGSHRLINRGGFGYSLTEKNTRLQGTEAIGDTGKLGELEHMLLTNPTAATGYRSMVATLTAVDFDIIAHANAKARVVGYTEELLFERMLKPWAQTTETILNAPGFGFAPHEITTYREAGKTWIRDLDYRPPRTIELHTVTAPPRDWVSCRQRWYDEQGTVQTADYGRPAERGKGWLFWPIFGQGSGPFGTSVLRPIYNEHKEKEDVRKIRRIAIQKALFGTMMAFRDPKHQVDQQEWDNMIDELGDLFMHEQGAIGIPAGVKEIVPAYASSDAIEKAIEAENHADVQILLSFASQWMGRGLLAAYGTNAASKTDATEQRNMRRYYLRWLSYTLQPLINFFVDFNFGPQRYYPSLRAVYREDLTISEEIDGTIKLIKAKVIKPDDALEVHFRRRLSLPNADPDTAREVPDAPAGGFGGNPNSVEEPETPGAYHDDEPDTRERQSEGDYT